jgi:succinoglycan biosynthesis transport protein ExoP
MNPGDTMTDPHAGVAVRPPLAIEPSGGGIDYVFLLDALRRQMRLIAMVVVGGLILTFLALLMATPRYTATASILLDTRQPKVFNADTVLPALSDDLYIIESQLEILRSPRIAGRVIRELKARERSVRATAESSAPKAALIADVAHASATPEKAEDASTEEIEEVETSVVVELLRDLVVERKGRSYMVEVSYTSDNAQRSAMIANAFVEAYVADQQDAKFQATRGANLWLKERLQEIGRELEDLEQRRQRFRADRGLIGIGDVTLLQKETSEHVQQLIAARATAAEAEARLSQVRALAAAPKRLLSLDVALQSTVISDYRRQAAEIQRKIGEGTSLYGEQHPTVMGLKAQLDNLNKEVEQEIKRIIDSRKLAFEAASGKVDLLEAGLQKLRETVLKYDEHQIKLSEFMRQVSVSSDLYSSLLRRYKETRAQEKLQATDARIVSSATAPLKPSYPKKLLVSLLACVAWLGVGAGLGLAREIKHRPLRSPADVESALGVECVTTMPIVDLTPLSAEEKQPHSLCGPIHWMLDDSRFGDFTQAIFTVKKWTETCGGQAPCVVAVVAAHPAEGCSTVAAQLALFAANTGTHTILVDADLRSRGLTDALGIAAETTLPDAILSGSDPKSAIVPLPDANMSLCPAPGQGNWRPLHVLGSRAAGKFFGALRDEFDLIVVDTPPVTSYVDAKALVEHADCVLVVVRAGQTHIRDVSEVLRRLGTDGRPAIGVVLNMMERYIGDDPSPRTRSGDRKLASRGRF